MKPQITDWQAIEQGCKIINIRQGIVSFVGGIALDMANPIHKKSCFLASTKPNTSRWIYFDQESIEDYKIWSPKVLYQRK